MMLYKLTTQDWRTRAGFYNETRWGRGVTHRANGTGGLCTDGLIHAYEDARIALLLNPIGASIWRRLCEMRSGFRACSMIRMRYWRTTSPSRISPLKRKDAELAGLANCTIINISIKGNR